MESAPLNTSSPSLLQKILIGLAVLLIGGYVYMHFTHKQVIVCNKGISITTAKPALVVQAPVKVTPVVQAPVVVAKPVVVTPQVAPQVVTPAPVHVAPSHPVPYMNHGNFIHGNSTPSWPYHAGHHR
jgi:hypothetical protein